MTAILQILILLIIVRLTWALLGRERPEKRRRGRKEPKTTQKRFDMQNRDVVDADFEEMQ
jgi:Tfp pilus assembly protein PilO